MKTKVEGEVSLLVGCYRHYIRPGGSIVVNVGGIKVTLSADNVDKIAAALNAMRALKKVAGHEVRFSRIDGCGMRVGCQFYSTADVKQLQAASMKMRTFSWKK